MFTAPPRVAWTLTIAAAVAAGAMAASSVAPLGPWLALHLSPMPSTPDTQTWLLRAEAHGGEPIPVVRLEIVSGAVDVKGNTEFFSLPPDNAALFTLRVRRDEPADPLVRVHQGGYVDRTYDVTLPVTRR